MKQIAVVARRDGTYAGQARVRGDVFTVPAAEAAVLAYRREVTLATPEQARTPPPAPLPPEPAPTPRRRRTYRRRDLNAEPA